MVMGRSRLLFVAHRQEILDQSQATFRHVLRDPGFGEQWIGGRRPLDFEHVFASIQSLANADLDAFDPAHFDVVIVDEFHHAAAPSYERLLRHVQPTELLGLTATPERADGTSVVAWFEDRIAAELRLWDAIEQHYLAPFAYYGIYDGLDLTDVPWRRGRGYDVDGLSTLYTANDVWATNVLKELIRHVGDVGGSRCLAFCVSVDHARFMSRVFTQAGVNAVAVSGATTKAERRSALQRLRDGKINVLFSVDLFNEGVDVPSVDTLLLLRPTDSPVLFLQQLGRGLRKEQDKPVCTVLDFVGEHRREFRFDRRFRSLLGGSRKELAATVAAGFPYLPAGCHMELDRKTSEIVLRSIRTSLPSRWPQKVEELRALANSTGGDVTLAEFLDHSGLELEDVYDGRRCWSDLRNAAHLAVLPAGPHEATLRRSLGRLLHTDDADRLEAWAEVIEPFVRPTRSLPSKSTSCCCRMLVHQLLDQLPSSVISSDTSLATGIALVRGHPQVCSEVAELAMLLRDRIGHMHPAGLVLGSPLVIHARYTRLEILAALGIGEGARSGRPWREGVMYLPEVPADVLAITLDKTGAGFSPTTRYRDYAISPTLIHWESQSTTPANSPTGQRYQHHAVQGSSVLMFARLNSADRAFWFLGRATYVRHSGERPMAITWQLEHPLPGDLFVRFAAAVA